MKRLELEYGGGSQTVFFDAVLGRFFGYEDDREEIHQLYGGNPYYTSNTGQTGAGYIDQDTDRLFKVGWYRTDCNQSHLVPIKKYTYVFYPLENHGLTYQENPVVHIKYEPWGDDKHRDVFIIEYGPCHGMSSIKNLVDGFDYDEDGVEKEIEFNFHYFAYERTYPILIKFRNSWGCKGPDFLRFVSQILKKEGDDSLFKKDEMGKENPYKFLKIYPHLCGGWYRTKYDLIVERFGESDIENVVLQFGWHKENGVWWQRRGDDVYLIASSKRGKYAIEETEFCEYEENVPVFYFFQKEEKEKIIKWMKGKLLRKLREDFLRAGKEKRNIEGFLNILKENPERVLTIQDSIDAGNCKVGTDNFIEKFFGPEEKRENISYRELLGHEKINEMLKIFDFRKLII